MMNARFGYRAGENTDLSEMPESFREAEYWLVVADVQREERVVAVSNSGIVETRARVVSSVLGLERPVPSDISAV